MEKIQVSLKSDKSEGTLHEDLCTVMTIHTYSMVQSPS